MNKAMTKLKMTTSLQEINHKFAFQLQYTKDHLIIIIIDIGMKNTNYIILLSSGKIDIDNPSGHFGNVQWK